MFAMLKKKEEEKAKINAADVIIDMITRCLSV